MTVVSAGNAGSDCSTVDDPPAIYDASYSVGALNKGTDTIASFSSRGPVTVDGSGRRKPDICAPGTDVRSSVPGSLYEGGWSGTSMAGPHVAGAVALLWSARPELLNQVDATETALNAAAFPISTTACLSSGVPNNVFGYGRLDVRTAVGDVPTPTVTPTPTGTPTITVTPTALPTAPPPPPPAEITLNGALFGPGNALTAEFTLHRSIKQPFIAYAVFILPGGSMVDAVTLGPVKPLVTFMPALGAPFSYRLVSTTIHAGAPTGTYEIVAAFFDPYGPITGRGDAFLEAASTFTIR
jgi:hypothetical protein